MHNSLTIKNLAIAVEALSHCQSTHIYDVEKLLKREIRKAQENETPPPQAHNLTDDIPF